MTNDEVRKPSRVMRSTDGGLAVRGASRNHIGDAKQLLAKEPARIERVLPYFISSLEAIDKAHAVGQKHSVLSPYKIRFAEDGTANVPTSNVDEAAATVAFGSAKYAAPESFAQNGYSSDCAARDCYIVGFIFYEILLGARLFEAQFKGIREQGEYAWLAWHLDKAQHVKPLSEAVASFPHALSQLIDGMLAKDPDERNPNFIAIARTLSGALQTTRVFDAAMDRPPHRGVAAPGSMLSTQMLPHAVRRWFAGLAAAWEAFRNTVRTVDDDETRKAPRGQP